MTGKGIELSGFALTAMGQRQADVAAELILAVNFYLADRDSDRPGWRYPSNLPDGAGAGEQAVMVELDPGLWDALAAEAERQQVTVDRLAAHAALYFAAELDAGRITERIISDLEDGAASPVEPPR